MMHGFRSLWQGLVLSVLATSTLLGAMLIAAHESFTGPIGPAAPTQVAVMPPGMFDIPTLTPTPTPNPSITSTPTPTPFVCATPSGEWRVIEFKPLDDSLIVIAQTFQISLQQLIDVNCLDRRPQLSWQALYVPAPTAQFGATPSVTAMPTLSACVPTPGGLAYVVRFGDTLSRIAQIFRVSIIDLVNYNCFAPNVMLIAGTTIMLPPYALRITPTWTPIFIPPTWTFTPTPTAISPTPSWTPTNPPIITETFTPTPTNPPVITDTPTPTPTDTAVPSTPTDTPTVPPPTPTDTPTVPPPAPTDMPTLEPTPTLAATLLGILFGR